MGQGGVMSEGFWTWPAELPSWSGKAGWEPAFEGACGLYPWGTSSKSRRHRADRSLWMLDAAAQALAQEPWCVQGPRLGWSKGNWAGTKVRMRTGRVHTSEPTHGQDSLLIVKSHTVTAHSRVSGCIHVVWKRIDLCGDMLLVQMKFCLKIRVQS